jgi:hypothetical protein
MVVNIAVTCFIVESVCLSFVRCKFYFCQHCCNMHLDRES